MRKVCNRDHSMRGFLWCVRRASDRSPVHAPPFSAARRAMRFDRGGIDRQGHAVLAAVGQRGEDRLPMSALGPAIKAIVDGRIWPIVEWAIAPARAALKHVDDAADDASIVIALRTSLVSRQARLYPHPLHVAKPKQSLAHRSRPLAESLGTRESEFGN